MLVTTLNNDNTSTTYGFDPQHKLVKTLASTLAVCALGIALIAYLYIKVIESGFVVEVI